jgi:hypothetical protein
LEQLVLKVHKIGEIPSGESFQLLKQCLRLSRDKKGFFLTRLVKKVWQKNAANLLDKIANHQGQWTREDLENLFRVV